MKTKQLVQNADRIVEEMLDGLVLAQPHLTLVEGEKVVLHRDFEAIRERQVTLLSGGGSGHEPAHAGYIGEGMLTGVICGNVFASPTTQQVLAAIRLVAGPKGCLIIVKNYTGDRINFGLAVEQAKAEGYIVDMVVIGEDAAVVNANAGRRGLSGTVYIHKLAGAAAAKGLSLSSIVDVVNKVATTETLGTIGVAIKPCTLPGHDGPSRELGPNEMELGLGIHGEPGIEKCELEDAPVITNRMVERLAGALSLQSSSKAVLMVNNLGASTTMELFVVAKHAIESLKRRGVVVERTVVGSFMTALDMSGFSLTVWKVDGNSELLELFDAATTAPAWNYSPFSTTAKPQSVKPVAAKSTAATFKRPAELSANAQLIEASIRAASEALIASEPDLTAWDAKVGDGDCGHTFKCAAQKILADLESSYPLDNAGSTLRALANSVSQSAGGTSGVLYTIFITAAAVKMESFSSVSPVAWAASFVAGIDAVQRYGGAREGSRTMLDALLPAARALGDVSTASDAEILARLSAVVEAAETGADKTSSISTSKAFGRSGYVGDDNAAGVPDPGAKAAAIWIRAAVSKLK
ncbi:hypothetical protein Poli38472_014019 [Pythium oligandrum]|uniref:Dihydroxyacetone kinase n=1 Tax=Pythium oligandrum TaxID=41045 RepID=A0A8K1FPA0_PYTOL|nr:hypothetical protein Poli38472_014019 [Pythium oligandrum]|eukprot:TMW66707.1 hypothetical protein Poli38472_014019 [Pythium oligandrum]